MLLSIAQATKTATLAILFRHNDAHPQTHPPMKSRRRNHPKRIQVERDKPEPFAATKKPSRRIHALARSCKLLPNRLELAMVLEIKFLPRSIIKGDRRNGRSKQTRKRNNTTKRGAVLYTCIKGREYCVVRKDSKKARRITKTL